MLDDDDDVADDDEGDEEHAGYGYDVCKIRPNGSLALRGEETPRKLHATSCNNLFQPLPYEVVAARRMNKGGLESTNNLGPLQ